MPGIQDARYDATAQIDIDSSKLSGIGLYPDANFERTRVYASGVRYFSTHACRFAIELRQQNFNRCAFFHRLGQLHSHPIGG